ncbi:kin of IRRE-like protein 1 [Polyodon spathula]|uniref:kin of IRRE-like protein 1 n=1 Tax=Polyodon spathula TaxID=7913 RepID=UPI001B7DDC34|nr:kin of IRRE-like protein 1 [Polyodon spathula]
MRASWIVLSLCLLEGGRAAYFSQEPQDQMVVSGQSVTLPCVIVGYRGMVQWTKDGLALGGERDLPGWTRYSIMGAPMSDEHSLLIDSAELTDDAVYECQATQAALRSHRARLTVLVPPEDPTVDDGPVVRLKAHEPYNLTCRASGAKPAAEITWYREGELQEAAVYSKSLMEDGKRELSSSMLLVTPEDQDTGRAFTCHVSNPAAPAGKQTSVTLNVQHPPTVTLSVEPQTVLEGAKVLFVCFASANPEITGYRWAKGGVLISEANGDSLEATVDHTYFTDPVSCEVSNSVGSTNVSTLVDVQFGPMLMSEPKPQSVDVGMDAAFTCSWTGNPPLTLAWTKVGSNVVSGPALIFSTYSNNPTGTMKRGEIPKVNHDESAKAVLSCPLDSHFILFLTCHRNGKHSELKAVPRRMLGAKAVQSHVPLSGSGEQEVTLTVKVRPAMALPGRGEVERPHSIWGVLCPPLITAEPLQHAAKGGNAKLECFVDSTPPPDKIYRDGPDQEEPLGGTVLRLSPAKCSGGGWFVASVAGGVMSSLVITETTEHDFSIRYNCSAWNRFGEGVALLTLQEQEVLPLMIIVGAAVGGGAILLACILVIILLRCRNSGKGEVKAPMHALSKSDIRVQIVHSDHNVARTNEDEEEDVKETMVGHLF